MRLRFFYFMQFVLMMACFAFSHAAYGAKHRPHTQSILKTIPNLSALHKSETIKFPIYAPRAISARNDCDSSGNIFLLFAPSQANPLLRNISQPFAIPNVMNQAVHEFKIHDQEIIAFGGPEISNINYLPGNFTVNHEDHVFRMFIPNNEDLQGRHPDDVIVQYDPDGSFDAKIHLHVPHHWEFDTADFIAFDDGNFLITGMLHPRPPAYRPGQKPTRPIQAKPFMAIFDDQGNLISTVYFPRNSRVGPKHPIFWPRIVATSAMAAGPDDTAYLLSPQGSLWLYTLSSDGIVIHKARVNTSQFPHAQLLSMNVIGKSQLLLDFWGAKMDARHAMRPISTFAVVDVNTGNILQAYRMPSGRGMSFACASDPHHIEYLSASRKGKLEVSIYSSR